MAKYLDEDGVRVLWARIAQFIYECCCKNGGGGGGSDTEMTYSEVVEQTPLGCVTCSGYTEANCGFLEEYTVTAEATPVGVQLVVSDDFSAFDPNSNYSPMVSIFETPLEDGDCPMWSAELYWSSETDDWNAEVGNGGCEIIMNVDNDILGVEAVDDGFSKTLEAGKDYVIVVYVCDNTPA